MATVQAKALKPILKNGEIAGYELEDTTGLKMSVNTNAIINAMKSRAINIINLKITDSGKLEMIAEQRTGNFKQEIGHELPKAEPKEVTLSQARRMAVQRDETNDSTDKVNRMHHLVKVLNEAIAVYEQGTDEIMSNYEYDKLYDELQSLESELNMTLAGSPTQEVGYEVVSALPKETHTTRMLSLDKTKDRESLSSWLKGKEGLLSWKMDGLTVVLTYEGGKLVKAVTRGNGEVGELVTPNAKHFKNVPRKIAFNKRLVIRGEAIITYSSFEAINAKIAVADEKYKNPRNLCSGSVRQLDSSITAQRNVEWYAFEVVEADGANFGEDYEKQLKWLALQGFSIVEYKVVTPETVVSAIDEFSTKVKSNNIPTDGLVLTFKDRAYGRSLGQTSKFPRHSIAFKWADETATTELEYIEWQVGRTGIITPVAIFKPVELEGTTVTRASLHNLSIMTELLGQPFVGQRIEVYKANMIIPTVLSGETLEDLGLSSDDVDILYIPGVCPVCGCETDVHTEPSSGVMTLWCENEECDAKIIRKLKHFVTRDAMNIDGVSAATLERFLEEEIITDLPSIFHIRRQEDAIVNLEGFGYKSFYNLVNAVEKARDVKIANLIYALGIPNIGLATAKLICKHFNNDLGNTVTANYMQLINIEGIGDVIAQSFTDWFADEANFEMFKRLVKEVRLIKEEISTDTSMAGVTICVTGDVYIFPNRRAIKELVENLGGKLTGSVSGSTSYLVTNDTTSGSNKNKAAQKHGIPILTEEQFIDKFNLRQYI